MPDSASQPTHARAEAVDRVVEWLEQQTYPDRLMADVSSHRAFIMEVLYGVIRWQRPLDWMIQQTSNRPPQVYTHAILLVALYELLYLDQGQDYATVNEAVALVKAKDHPSVGKYVNAVLRRVQRERAAWLDKLAKQPLALRHSHPDELFNRWTRTWGKEKTVSLCEWNNQPAEVFVRRQALQASASSFSESLKSAGTQLLQHEKDDRFFTVPRGVRIQDIPGYKEGCFIVQDPATMHAVDLLNAQPGESVLDACAAPGGKTVALWDAMKGDGRLVAADSSEKRLASLRATLARMRCEGVELLRADATAWGAKDERFDAVLIDAPCTNTGVIRRRPDARWRFSKKYLQQYVDKQRALLTSCAGAVRLGGRLVYSTCSLEPEENEMLIDQWLAEHPSYEEAETKRTFPPDSKTDGAYTVLLKKRA